MAKLTDLTTLAKTNVDNADYLLVTSSTTGSSQRLTVASMFPAVSTAGTSSETLYNSATLTNKNQIVFKGLKSGTTSNLTVATTSSNLVLSLVEAGIDLNACDNTTSLFMSGVDFTKTVTSQCPVVNGGTGLSAIAKGAMLYASAANVITATAAMSTNGQVLIGNASTGIPTVSTLTAGSNVTITNAAGAITIASSLGTMAANLDMYDGSAYTYNIDLNEGNGWISGSGIDEGITVDGDGKVFIGEGAPIAAFADTLNIKGGIRFTNTDAPTIKPTATTNSTTGQSVTIESGGSDAAAAGNLLLTGGTAAGNGAGGDVILTAGRDTSGTADGDIQLKTYAGSSATAGLTVATQADSPAAVDVTVNTGNLVITTALKGIIHTGTGTVTQGTNATTTVNSDSTSGIITLFGAALASQAEVEFTFTNDSIKATSVIITGLECVATGRTAGANIQVYVHSKTSESCKIIVVNIDDVATDVNDIFKINYLIINPS